MKKKYLLTSLLSLLISSVSIAQNNLGASYFASGELNVAKNIFTKELSTAPTAEAYYYLGEVAFAEGNTSEAQSNYEKGLALTPDYALNTVGLGKLLLKSNPKAAEDLFSTAIKKDKKNVAVLVSVARAYHEAGMEDKADKAIADARKAKNTSPLIYLFEGDRFKETKNPGKATGQYAQAINFDPNCALAYIKSGQIYESADVPTAIENYKKALEVQPDFLVANKYIGRLYYRNRQYPECIEAYKKYFATGDYSSEDLVYFAGALNNEKKFDASKLLILEGLKSSPNNFYMNRLLMYNYVDLGETENAITQADKFFALPLGSNDKYFGQDYTTYAKALYASGQVDKAISQVDKAITIDPKSCIGYKDLAEKVRTTNNDTLVVKLMEKYIQAAGPDATSMDYYILGSSYMTLGAPLLAKKDDAASVASGTDYINKADAAFEKITELNKNIYLGYQLRARANAQIDPDLSKGLAKPYYEQMITVILAETDHTKNNAMLIEAYNYLGYYYNKQFTSTKNADFKSQAKDNFNKTLELDPTNANAKDMIELLKK